LDGDFSDETGGPSSLAIDVCEWFVPARTGQSGQALRLSPQTCASHDAQADDRLFQGTGVTIMAWVRLATDFTCPATPQNIFRRGSVAGVAIGCAGGQPGLASMIRLNGDAAAGFVYGPVAGQIALGQWTHVAITWDKQVVRTYLDGQPVAGADRAAQGELMNQGAPNALLALGCESQNFAGDVDDLSLLASPLSAAQIGVVYANGGGVLSCLPSGTICGQNTGPCCGPIIGGQSCLNRYCGGRPPLCALDGAECDEVVTCCSGKTCTRGRCPDPGSTCINGCVVTEFAIPSKNSGAGRIAAGPDGNLWFTEQTANKIGRITPTGTISEFPIPTAGSDPLGICGGADGNVWFVEATPNRIGRITPAGTITEFPIPSADSGPVGIAAGPDGNLWFTERMGNRIGRITLPAGSITEFALPNADRFPGPITAGPDGNLWFIEDAPYGIGRMTPAGVVVEFPIPTRAQAITAGPDGNVWFTEASNKLGRITPAGVTTELAVPFRNGEVPAPYGIVSGSDGNLWFTESANTADSIGRMTPTGTLTEFWVPGTNLGGVGPFGIARGPDGNVWFTELQSNLIGRVTN